MFTNNPVQMVIYSLKGGKFRVRLSDSSAKPGRRQGHVLDENDNIVGDASDAIYSGRGFAIHTAPFGGFVPAEQVEFV